MPEVPRSEGASLTATGNSVWLGYDEGGAAQYDALDLSAITVYGGATKHTTSDTFYAADTGNTIHASGIVSVKALRGYSGLTLNISQLNAMGTATDPATGASKAVLSSAGAVDLSSRSLTLTAEDEGLAGQNYALLYSASGVTLPGDTTTEVMRTGTFTSTIYANASVRQSDDGTLLYADLTSASLISATTLNPEAETLSAAALAGAAMAGTLNSFSSADGLDAAAESAGATAGVAAFGALGGGRLRYEVGSHVSVTSLSATVGAARMLQVNGGGSLTVAAFLDLGTGTSKPHVGNASASADNTLYGAGLGARYSFQGGAFLDASARVGRARAEFKGSYLRTGLETRYDSRATYYGLSLGGGYRLGVNDALALTPYARYTLTHLGSDTVSLRGLTSRLHLDPVTAHTLRAGVDARWRLSGTAALTAGLAVERTWRGRAESQLGGIDLKAPSLAGTSGIIDVGVTLTPESVKGLSLSLG
ncbi:MAG: autotransporter outer membrane beta-barrel domain-containing protein, partial [Succinivibrionaceae bacterium]|nr:autotransporter outer membrane beta-barrel domain-containing protein [Succinivibrionaceae bacterium]